MVTLLGADAITMRGELARRPYGEQGFACSLDADVDELPVPRSAGAPPAPLFPLPAGPVGCGIAAGTRSTLDTSPSALLSGALGSLNALHASRVRRPLLEDATSGPPIGPGDIRAPVVSDLVRRVADLGDAPEPPDASAAVMDMLGSSACERLDRGNTVRPFDVEKVKVLESPVGCQPLLPLLSEQSRLFAENPEEHMLLPPSDDGAFDYASLGRPYSALPFRRTPRN